MWGPAALGNCPHGLLRLWATLCPQRPCVICCNCSFQVQCLVHSFSGRENFMFITSVMPLHLHSVQFSSDTMDSVAVVPSRCVAGTDYIWQVESSMEPFPWRRKKKNQTKNRRLIFLMVEASSLLFREQKESLGLRREGKMRGMGMHLFFFTVLSQVDAHLVLEQLLTFILPYSSSSIKK